MWKTLQNICILTFLNVKIIVILFRRLPELNVVKTEFSVDSFYLHGPTIDLCYPKLVSFMIYVCSYTIPENVLFSPRPTTHLEALP